MTRGDRCNAGVIAAMVLYLALAGVMAFTKRPWADEAWFASMSVNILENGKTGISVLDPRGNANMLGREFPRIDEVYCVWTPLQQTVYAGWYRVMGFHLLTMRAFSMLWGLAALFSWFFILRCLTGDRFTGALACVLIGTDFAFVDAASDGRMDMMCAALAFGAMAGYLLLRERRLGWAIAASQALGVAAGLTHPMGAVGFLVTLALIFRLDFRRLGWRHLGIAAAVYAAGVVAAAAYVLPNLELFRIQLGVAAAGRVTVAQGNILVREITEKYRNFYLPPNAGGVALLRVLIPVIYALGLIGSLAVRSALPLVTALSLLVMASLDNGKLYYYLVHSTPYLAATLAVAGAAWAKRGGLAPAAACAAVVVLCGLQLSWVAATARKDAYHNSFLPMAKFVRGEIQRGGPRPALVMASAELGFVLGFLKSTLRDDALLGFQSGWRPDIVVMEERSYGSHYEGFQRHRPEVAAHIRRLLEQFRLVYNDGYYKVYAR